MNVRKDKGMNLGVLSRSEQSEWDLSLCTFFLRRFSNIIHTGWSFSYGFLQIVVAFQSSNGFSICWLASVRNDLTMVWFSQCVEIYRSLTILTRPFDVSLDEIRNQTSYLSLCFDGSKGSGIEVETNWFVILMELCCKKSWIAASDCWHSSWKRWLA